MIQIFEYIIHHWAWILSGAILILLAIIGYYADKTNFGQGTNFSTKKDDSTDDFDDVSNLGLLDATNNLENQEFDLEKNNVLSSADSSMEQQELANMTMPIDGIITEEDQGSIVEDTNELLKDELTSFSYDDSRQSIIENDNLIKTNPIEKNSKVLDDESIEMFNNEFESVLPKKELIDTDLLEDIDDLELDKTRKLNLDSIPSLDDLELPKIKTIYDEGQDIWKF